MNKHNSKLVKEILNDINRTITELRNNDLLLDEQGIVSNITSGGAFIISFDDKSDVNKILFDPNIPASDLIDKLLKKRQYTILLYDKSIIQGEFIIHNEVIKKERLIFIKKHNKVWTKQEIENAENEEGDWFTPNNGVPIFLRIDYDPENHIDCEHPICHLTLSNAGKCRIPIKEAVTFSEFVRFVLLHFFEIKLNVSQYRIENCTITNSESQMIHIDWE